MLRISTVSPRILLAWLYSISIVVSEQIIMAIAILICSDGIKIKLMLGERFDIFLKFPGEQ